MKISAVLPALLGSALTAAAADEFNVGGFSVTSRDANTTSYSIYVTYHNRFFEDCTTVLAPDQTVLESRCTTDEGWGRFQYNRKSRLSVVPTDEHVNVSLVTQFTEHDGQTVAIDFSLRRGSELVGVPNEGGLSLQLDHALQVPVALASERAFLQCIVQIGRKCIRWGKKTE